MRLFLPLTPMIVLSALLACSHSEAPGSSLSLAATYHLRSIGGVQVPISQGGGVVDSGEVRRLEGDTVRIDRFSHSAPSNGLPGTQIVSFGTWLAAQSGDVIVLHPLLASSIDTLFVGRGDTLTRHSGLGIDIELYVAP